MPRDIPVGNGKMLLCLDRDYRLRELCFPHVGQENHMHGKVCRLGVWTEEQFSWVGPDWRQGTMPKEKWNLFGLKVLTRFGTSEDLSLEVKVSSKTKDSTLKQQLNNALRDLGLMGDFEEK